MLGDPADRRLWRIDPVRKRIVATIDLGFAPRSLAVGAGSVWITDQLDDKVIRLDPQTNRVTASIPVGRGASAVAVGRGHVQVANSIDHTVSPDRSSNRAVVETIDVGPSGGRRSPTMPSGLRQIARFRFPALVGLRSRSSRAAATTASHRFASA